MNYITFDIETYSPSRLDKIDTDEFRCSVCGAYFSWLDEYIAFLEEDIVDFLNMTREADLIVGYNHIGFDLPVLQKYVSWNLQELPKYDIMAEIHKNAGFRPKLNDICKANLNHDVKTDSYEVYKNYYWDKEWGKLIDYCMNDVRLTEQIFRIVLKENKLKYLDLNKTYEVMLAKPIGGRVEIEAKTDFIF
jgi:DEAD/DEAH box helicase domain-containing protein